MLAIVRLVRCRFLRAVVRPGVSVRFVVGVLMVASRNVMLTTRGADRMRLVRTATEQGVSQQGSCDERGNQETHTRPERIFVETSISSLPRGGESVQFDFNDF